LAAMIKATLEPRKQPVQARSAASVEAILEATVQVLLDGSPIGGLARLTTTRVAARAGVSVGTLYQYFPNKSALMQAVLRRHLSGVTEAVDRVCAENMGQSLRTMATALVHAFLDAKMKNPRVSVAFYSAGLDINGAKVAAQVGLHANKSLAKMLASSPEPLSPEPTMVASMLQGMLAGMSRKLLESSEAAKELAGMRQELVVMACAYLDACSTRALAELPESLHAVGIRVAVGRSRATAQRVVT
jgi:AcrR family transcriptional regulator